MEIRLYQLVVTLIAAFMLYDGVERFRRREATQSPLKLLVRFIVWGGMAVVALFPRITEALASFIGFEDNLNAIVLTGFLLVFLLIFKILSIVERLERRLTELVRHKALNEFKNND